MHLRNGRSPSRVSTGECAVARYSRLARGYARRGGERESWHRRHKLRGQVVDFDAGKRNGDTAGGNAMACEERYLAISKLVFSGSHNDKVIDFDREFRANHIKFQRV